MKVDWTGASDADLDAWVAALAEIEAFDRTGETLLREDLVDELSLSYVDPDADVRLGWADGRIVAWGSVVCIPNVHQRRVQVSGAVVPDRRGTGIGTELRPGSSLGAASWHAPNRPTRPVGSRSVPPTATASARTCSRRSGSSASGTTSRCAGRWAVSHRRRDRWRHHCGWCPTTSRTTARRRDAHNEAFRDHFAANELDAETWARWVTGGHGFRPDCSYLVLDGEEVAGYVLNSVHPDDWPGLGFTEGWTHQLGVRRPWRGRGIATVLLDLSAAAFAAEGLDFAALDVDAENPTGALGLYESQGYHRDKTRVAWSRPVG